MERCAEPALRLGVDEFILDYLVYMALRGILKDYKRAQSGARNVKLQRAADLTLHMVNGEQLPSIPTPCIQRNDQARLLGNLPHDTPKLPG